MFRLSWSKVDALIKNCDRYYKKKTTHTKTFLPANTTQCPSGGGERRRAAVNSVTISHCDDNLA